MVRPVMPIVALSLLLLVGCSSSDRGDLLQPKQTEADSGDESSDESGIAEDDGELPEAKDGTDIGACSDGECEVEISGSVSIPMDKKFDIKSLDLAVKAGELKADIVFTGGGTGTMSFGGNGGQGYVNNLYMAAIAIFDDTAIVVMEATET